ncbi:hypothetical protein JZM27_02860 [Providencia huaxiensis]|uniref:hypothetical protein n=1 Tax=Providencia huaxiensis TaxID=2027290 RepID=UPI0019D24C57|nr:hypothetical protein [Providencia huaxiensis]MBN6360176.1 hypothetical protein [Providencia huaxiensis]
MTVSTEISSNEYTGNGVTTDFDYKFRIFKANQLSVISSDADGDNVVTLRLGTDYTVTGANKSAGGKVILTRPLANGHKISIAREIPITQETSFRNQGKFLAETHEDAFDYLTMIVQRIWGSIGSLYLKRPNILANWFDAKGYRIANLGKPKRDSDAVDLGTLKDEISGVNSTILKREKRLLRVDDMDIAVLPKAGDRAGNVLTFDKDGKPIVVAPASGSAVDVLNQLAKSTGSGLIGHKSLVCNAVQRTLQEKLSEGVSVKDFGVVGDGVTDDTDAWVNAVTCANTMKFDLYLPRNTRMRLTRNTLLPRFGFHGAGHTVCSVTLDIMALPDGISALTYGADDDWNVHGQISGIRFQVKDEDSTIDLIRIKTPSRGSGMRDCTIHVGRGSCVVADFFYYFNFDNVVFEGKYVALGNINSENPLRGNGFRWPVSEEINNIAFRKCEFKFLATVFQGGDVFVGSNTINLDTCSFESIGDNFGSLLGMHVTFQSCYFENFGLNVHNWSSIDETFAKTGAGNAVFNQCLFNMSLTNPAKPIFTSVIGNVEVNNCTLSKPSGFSSSIIAPITYSTRGKLIAFNSIGFDDFPPAYKAVNQQHVGGYESSGANKQTPQVVSASIGNYNLEFLAIKKVGALKFETTDVCHLILRTSDDYLIRVETKTIGRHQEAGVTAVIVQESVISRPSSSDTGIITGVNTVTSKRDPYNIFDGSWSDPIQVYATQSIKNGSQRLVIQATSKAETDYPLDVAITMKVLIIPMSAQTGSIGIVPIHY